jgi:hypothetical protein
MPLIISDVLVNYNELLDNFIVRKSTFVDHESGENYKKNILNNFDFIYNDPDVKKALVVGKIQAGKTLFYTGFITRFFDQLEGVCIVLAGTKTNLREQTYIRLSQDLSSLGIFIKDSLQNFDSNPINRQVYVVLKHNKYIKQLYNYLEYSAVKNVLIIDDESDQASLNNYNYSNLKKGEDKASITHAELIKVIYQSNRAKYIQITATPQAHVLADMSDVLRPDIMLALPTHNNYFGNKDFFSDSSISQIIDGGNDKLSLEILRFFIKYFYNACRMIEDAIRFDNISCFVHSDYLNENNENIFIVLKEQISRLKKIIIENVEFVFFDFNTEREIGYLRNNKNTFLSIIQYFSIQRVYGSHDKDLDWESFFNNNKYFCLIGGNKLERGFTIEGLITTYFTRISKGNPNSDTFEQRCRFYGNRRHLLPYLTVFVTTRIFESLLEYYNNEKHIFSILESTAAGVKNSNEIRKGLTNVSIEPTRKSVISHPLYHLLEDKWHFMYFNQEDLMQWEDIIRTKGLGERHDMSGDAELNVHYVYNICASRINEVLKKKKINKGSKDYFYIQILTRFISDLSFVKVIALSDFKMRHRNYSRLLGTLKIPNAVHSSRNNSASYKGDSHISTPEQNFSIQVGKYCDHDDNNTLIVMAFKIHNND